MKFCNVARFVVGEKSEKISRDFFTGLHCKTIGLSFLFFFLNQKSYDYFPT